MRGDRLGIDLPAHPQALRDGGPGFLTRAFRRTGVLAADNEVIAITRSDEWSVGGTGSKMMLSVAYAWGASDLATDLFVKFSRNFTDRGRDRVRMGMEPEVHLANLSRDPAFPIAVPRCLYADFQHASGTGIIITERIAYGEAPIEPHHTKCMDQGLPEPLEHYRALIATLALLSGTHKAGALGPVCERDFPLDLAGLLARRNRYDAAGLASRADRMAAFIARYPHLFPEHLTEPAFLEGFREAVPLYVAQQAAIRRFHFARADMLALCHWNANIDNAWFWREADELRCGLIDWGTVGQMHIARAIWGCLSAAEPDFVNAHLDALLELFVQKYAKAGGPEIASSDLDMHLGLQVMMSGLAWLMSAPPLILAEVPDPAAATDRHDAIFTARETARVQLKVMIGFLNIWHRRDLSGLLRSGRFQRS
ncbi:hypothetical protein [Novosphingobium aquimarinum]|uniref:hypothetical protein n=1 Tax=Novosphingobium aquimarinum TaxID=2682494 RepID=UPI0018DD5D2F|nr:hypothetical protein [Novosphingobium aquimarinum]